MLLDTLRAMQAGPALDPGRGAEFSFVTMKSYGSKSALGFFGVLQWILAEVGGAAVGTSMSSHGDDHHPSNFDDDGDTYAHDDDHSDGHSSSHNLFTLGSDLDTTKVKVKFEQWGNIAR